MPNRCPVSALVQRSKLMRKPVVTVVGSFAVGMTLRTSRMPTFGETLVGSDFDMGPGGKGSNQAVGVARLGAQSALVGVVGADRLAEIALELYAREGVDTEHLLRATELSTGVGFIILNQAGENGIIVDLGANRLVDAAYVDRAEGRLARSDVVMAVLEIPVEGAARAMELGRRHGARTILNPAPATALLPELLRHVDVLTPNDSELRVLMGLRPDEPASTLELARALRAAGPRTVVVTMGERGALIVDGERIEEVPSVSVDVVDTTGAGDAFNAALAVALAEGRELTQAVRYACCAGAMACTRLGVIPALPTREVVDRLFGGLPDGN